jgi:hypothetical protein
MYNKAIICMDDKRYDEMIMYLKMPLLFWSPIKV